MEYIDTYARVVGGPKEPELTKAAFVAQIARLTKDGECSTCRRDGESENPRCCDHQPWDGWSNDDAWETLMGLISTARELMAGRGE